MKKRKKKRSYIYIRLEKPIIERIKIIAKIKGSNMTIWARQNLIKDLENAEKGN